MYVGPVKLLKTELTLNSKIILTTFLHKHPQLQKLDCDSYFIDQCSDYIYLVFLI